MLESKTNLTITGDSGCIAIVNCDKYISFVDENWELPQLLKHFVTEMNRQTLIVWATGSENEWTISFSNTNTNGKAFNEFTKSITVTEGKLFLTNYEDLTMAAQFLDNGIPSVHNADLSIKLDNGNYNFTIRQMFDPNNEDFNSNRTIDFEIVFESANEDISKPVDKVFWWGD